MRARASRATGARRSADAHETGTLFARAIPLRPGDRVLSARHPPAARFARSERFVRSSPTGHVRGPLVERAAKSTSMSTILAELQAGLNHHQAGRLAEAEQVYRRVLAIDPQHA